MGLTLDFGMEKGNIACLKRGGEFPTAIGTPREPGFGDEAFWRSQVNLGPPNLATDEKDRGSVYVVTLPAFQRYLEDGPDAAPERIPHQQGTGDGHLEAHHDLQATPARPGKATRLGVRGSIVPAADFIFIIFESGGKGSLFCNGKKRSRFDSAQPNDTSNTNSLCLPILDSFQISYFD
ncbi:hypothetical protein M5K25_016328 [Dendrobium thyrsiflorum]|uniref:Uncharacterized protein n=1 Tax=Dendrobium thyrsiflorum TaxID=117978 RepID=A0ABD0UJ94_DENTH